MTEYSAYFINVLLLNGDAGFKCMWCIKCVRNRREGCRRPRSLLLILLLLAVVVVGPTLVILC